WLEAVVALPDQLFYNTGISTYFWVVTNRKNAERRGRVQLVDARELWVKMRKSLGEKRKAISPEQIDEITRLYGAFEENERVKVFRNEEFGYQRIAVEEYMAAEVLPYVPDAWVDHTKTKIGYEVPLTRHFYRYVPPRPLEEIDAEIRALEEEIQELLVEVTR